MAGGIAYLDTSALVKLVVQEPESDALVAALPRWSERVTSTLAEVELLRAIRRVETGTRLARRAREVLAQLHLLEVDAFVRQAAAALDAPMLRSLDAIHLASALTLGGELGVFVGYDRRLLDAAAAAGLSVAMPGR